MRQYRSLLFMLVLSFVLLVPVSSFAAVSDYYGPIIPEKIQTCAAGWAGLLAALNNLIKFILSFGILVAVLTFAYAGALLVFTAANPENRSKARSLIINAVIGLVIALGAWLIVNTVLGILTGGKNIDYFTGFMSGGDDCIQPSTTETFESTGSTLVTTNNTPVVGNEAVVRDQLKAAGIDVNKAPCPVNTRYQDVSGGCTTVADLRQATVDQIINVKNVCGSAYVTGGNELGHSSGHTNGSKVDLSTGISGCIEGGAGGYFTRDGSRGSDPQYKDKCGNIYVRELAENHWDITVGTSCAK